MNNFEIVETQHTRQCQSEVFVLLNVIFHNCTYCAVCIGHLYFYE